MSPILRACARCGKPSPGAYCPEHQRERWRESNRQTRMGIGGGTWEGIRKQVIARDLRCCYLCGEVVAEGERVEVDHLREVAEGGSNDLSNLATAHVSCHRRRHRDPEWAAERIEMALRSLGGVGGDLDLAPWNGTGGVAPCAGKSRAQGGRSERQGPGSQP